MFSPRSIPSIVLVVNDGFGFDVQEQFIERIERAWSFGVCPTFLYVEPAAALEADHASVTLVLSGKALSGAVRSLMGDERRSMVIVSDEPSVIRAGGATHVPVMGTRSPASALAGALHALAQRQRSFENILSESHLQSRQAQSAAKQLEQLHEEIALAALLQREMLPRTLPRMPGVELGVLYRPSSMLCGDAYDTQRLDEHRVGFLLADATGHGVSAALLMMLVSRLLVMKEICPGGYRIVPPGEALARLNDAFIERRGESFAMVSAVYGVIDSRDGSIEYACAGHPPPVLIGAQRDELLERGGPLLGLCAGAEFPTCRAQLAPGEVLLAYSDGFEGAFKCPVSPGNNELHIDAFRRLARDWATRGLDASIETLVGEMDNQRGSLHQGDDITLLCVARSAAAMRLVA
jgi:serine phosphatase RsbU (regulator of sigma subunit)